MQLNILLNCINCLFTSFRTQCCNMRVIASVHIQKIKSIWVNGLMFCMCLLFNLKCLFTCCKQNFPILFSKLNVTKAKKTRFCYCSSWKSKVNFLAKFNWNFVKETFILYQSKLRPYGLDNVFYDSTNAHHALLSKTETFQK